MAFEDKSGSEKFTSDGVVGISGKPCRIFRAFMISGAGAGQLILRNGTSATDTIYVNESGAGADAQDTYGADYFGFNGLEFPDGCYLDVNANTSYVVLEYRSEA